MAEMAVYLLRRVEQEGGVYSEQLAAFGSLKGAMDWLGVPHWKADRGGAYWRGQWDGWEYEIQRCEVKE